MRNEYPRPNFVRERWLSLNGKWDFGFTKSTTEQINVPFVYQSKLSNIDDKTPHDRVYYRRSFSIPKEWAGERVILHFGAVDYQCCVFINDHCVCNHEGGNTPFQCDITDYLTGETEEIFLQVYDPLDEETIPRGKQFWKEKGEFIWYTPSTGIWQSVWLEPVSVSSFKSIKVTSNIDKGTAEIAYELSDNCILPCTCHFEISLKGQDVVSSTTTCSSRRGTITLDIFKNKILNGPFHFGGLCWSPENPTLFDLKAVLIIGGNSFDVVSLYFGMRKISIHNKQLYLNNKPYYQKLVLDQGYWPESLLTAPTDEAYKIDIQKAKAMGFNGCRKHEKAEDPRFLYWADQLGFLVWGSMASCISYSNKTVTRFTKEWMDIIDRDYNHPCIILWGMLNESWGVPNIFEDSAQQSFSLALYHIAKSLDTTRLVATNDGWEQTGGDICALHSYRHGTKDDIEQHCRYADGLHGSQSFEKLGIIEHPAYAKGYQYENQPTIITEFGGISYEKDTDGWGYTSATNEVDLISEYKRIVTAIYSAEELCGFCYTQLTDVEQEKNGLLTANRDYKVDPKEIYAINNMRPTTR